MKKDNPDFLYEKESYEIIEACKEVWKEFGGSFKEKIIDKSLEIALKHKGYSVESQKKIDIYFKDEKVGTYIPDKIINGIILL
jgi:GxxExxY protein